ncbi:hypothetical protein G6F32_015846 [Rhizopus arrhizus]|nr:hypothetical protein G6F32_015846 [Rhizopus arrhizus]
MVDVKSTESATNITREELSRLPVDRDITAVALLAPGAVKGKGSLGGQGISFGATTSRPAPNWCSSRARGSRRRATDTTAAAAATSPPAATTTAAAR